MGHRRSPRTCIAADWDAVGDIDDLAEALMVSFADLKKAAYSASASDYIERKRLFDGDALGQVSWLVGTQPALLGDVVGEELERNPGLLIGVESETTPSAWWDNRVGSIYPEPMRVLCIAGPGRSGSTIMGNLLARLPGFIHIGELFFVWKRLNSNRVCTCGSLDCPIWQWARSKRSAELERLQADALRGPLTYVPNGYAAVHADLLKSIPTEVIVDTSKWPSYVSMLKSLNLDLRVVHLHRDFRGVAVSHKKTSNRGGLRFWASMVRHYLSETRAANQLADLAVGYEDFCADPMRVLRTITDLDALPPLGPMNHHLLQGNLRVRQLNPAEIRRDDSWKTSLNASERILGNAVNLAPSAVATRRDSSRQPPRSTRR